MAKKGSKSAKGESRPKDGAAGKKADLVEKVRRGAAKAAIAAKPAPPADPVSPATAPEARLEISASRNFVPWLKSQGASFAFTTYQASKIFLIGLQPNDRLSIYERTFDRCMGLWASPETLYITSVFQIWRFQNALAAGQSHQGYDRLYIPQVAWTTGDLDVHDLAVDRNGRVVFVNTLFSCLATVSDSHSFTPLWQPSFISKLAAEDRCHLNGLAMEDGVPRYVTAVAQSDAPDGWRDHRRDGGCIIDVTTGKILAEGLSMPHSPRLHEGRLWFLESGTGYLCTADRKTGKVERRTFCPGYLRGLALSGNFALVGLSKPRERTFSGLALDDNLASRKVEPQCGVMVVDLASGDAVHWLKISGLITELYDVAMLPGIHRPAALGTKADDIKRTVTMGGLETLAPATGTA
jgi:uncharacterized protein (TIGR03032 family)